MNLFVVGVSREGDIDRGAAACVLEDLAGVLPGLEGVKARGWTSTSGKAAAVSVAHEPDRIGGLRYCAMDDPGRMTLFAGRPYAWTGPGAADGVGPLDPSFYERPPSAWRGVVEGRHAVARWDGEAEALQVFTDAMGAYPLYATTAGAATWVGNSPRVLARLAGSEALSTGVLAAFLACGWSLGGDPVYERVRRLPRATTVTLSASGVQEVQDLLPEADIGAMFSAGLDPAAAAADVTAAAGALGSWAGRPNEVAVTGGKDSRQSFAAMLAAGVVFTGATKAFPFQDDYPDTPDVVVARDLCRATGTEHRVTPWTGDRNPLSDVRRAAQVLGVTGPGTVSLGDSMELPLRADAVLPLVHGGQGAESARAFYGAGEGPTGDALAERILGRTIPGYPAAIVNGDAREGIAGWLREWVGAREAAGVPPDEVPTMFHVLERLGTWAAPGLASRDVALDTTAPMWSARMLAHQVALPAKERLAGVYYPRVLEHLSPTIANLPYEVSKGRSVTVRRELRRRVLGSEKGVADPFPAAFSVIRDSVAEQSGHPAWDVLDGRRVRRLLRRDPGRLDNRSRQQVLRLGTVFLPA